MGHYPLLADFLEEQLWALRDRADVLTMTPMPEATAARLAVVTEEIADAALLLRRPTRTNREGVAVLMTRLRKMLEAIEREAWPRARQRQATLREARAMRVRN